MDQLDMESVKTTLEMRLPFLGQEVEPISEGRLEDVYGRADENGGIHYEVEIAGKRCAYSVWLFEGDRDTARDRRIGAQSSGLEHSGRTLAGLVWCIGSSQLLTEALALPGEEPREIVGKMRSFISVVWDRHARVALRRAAEAARPA